MRFFSVGRSVLDTRAENKKVTAQELAALIISPPSTLADSISAARSAARAHYERSAEKAALDAAKKRLPYFLNGEQEKGHSAQNLRWSGCVQIDCDIKQPGGDLVARRLLGHLKTHDFARYALLAALSPSGYGVKIICKVNSTDAAQYKAFERAAHAFVVDNLLSNFEGADAVKIDRLSVSQPCFIPAHLPDDPAPLFTPDALPLPITPAASEISRRSDERPAPAPISRPKNNAQQGANLGLNSSDAGAAALRYLLETRADVASCYDEYKSVVIACIAAMGRDGIDAARQILENSAAFAVSSFAKNYEKHANGLFQNISVTSPGALIKIAKRAGYKPAPVVQMWSFPETPPDPEPEPTNRYELNKNEYLSDAVKRLKIAPESLLNSYVVAPTGAGKTTLCADFARAGRKVVLVLPETLAVKNAAKKACFQGLKSAVFEGKNTAIVGDEDIIFVTLASFRKLGTRLGNNTFDVIFDEAHIFTTDAARAFRLDQIRIALDFAFEFARSVTALTGTEIYSFDERINDLQRVRFVRAQGAQKAKSAQIIRARKEQEETAQQCAINIAKKSAQAGRACVFMLNNKSEKKDAILHALKEEKAIAINTDTKKTEAFETLIAGDLPADVVLCTSVVRQGNDINDARNFDFVFLGAWHALEIEQITARARNAQSLRAYVVKGSQSEQAQPEQRFFNAAAFAAVTRKFAQGIADTLNAETECLNAAGAELKTLRMIEAAPVRETDAGVFIVDDLELGSVVFEREKQHQYANDAAHAHALRGFGFTIEEESARAAASPDPRDDDGRRAAVEAGKKEREARELEACDAIEKALNADKYASDQRYKSSAKSYAAFVELRRIGYEKNEALEAIRAGQLWNKRKRSKHKNTMLIHALMSAPGYLQSKRKFAGFLREILAYLDSVKEGETRENITKSCIRIFRNKYAQVGQICVNANMTHRMWDFVGFLGVFTPIVGRFCTNQGGQKTLKRLYKYKTKCNKNAINPPASWGRFERDLLEILAA